MEERINNYVYEWVMKIFENDSFKLIIPLPPKKTFF